MAKIGALAGRWTVRSDYIVNQAIEQYIEANTLQMQRISDGIAAACDSKVAPTGEVFGGIAAMHGRSG
ncbi:hypothetical protein [Roseinatronobacter alkalisoli]|uniref:CopG family transcriptional regulator n=1 Tax=Roseinatronobacter alkalisoli TaxID=3028235 RepID=A0ABT5TAZ4_9RHOB|nr:hypothetical protein [Roseinatronobacter sp. HJB301]MDD7972299.1 hypothetical protein [Roseinatronobacter sp. HJB301]